MHWPNGPSKSTNEKSPGSSTVVGPNFLPMTLYYTKGIPFPLTNRRFLLRQTKGLGGTNHLLCSSGISFANINLNNFMFTIADSRLLRCTLSFYYSSHITTITLNDLKGLEVTNIVKMILPW